jgi:hypothetical protein
MLAIGGVAGSAWADAGSGGVLPPGSDQDPPAAAPATVPAPLGERTPDDGVFTIYVLGDSLAEGLWGSLYRTLQRDPRFNVVNGAKRSSGICRPGFYDWPKAVDTMLEEQPVDAVVFAVGINDQLPMETADGKRVGYPTDPWKVEYQARLAVIMHKLVGAAVPTFWVGLPIMRDKVHANHARMLNEFFAAVTLAEGVTYIPTWDMTADENGEFSTYLPDQDGRKRMMRANDGIHFTSTGYDLLGRAILASMASELPVLQADATQ